GTAKLQACRLLSPEELTEDQPEHVVLHDLWVGIDALLHLGERAARIVLGAEKLHALVQHFVAQTKMAIDAVIEVLTAADQNLLESGEIFFGAIDEVWRHTSEVRTDFRGVLGRPLADSCECTGHYSDL